ncbi:hypothetical protein KM295_06315 [Natronomonas sp. F2-12]|uniref:Streptomycin biosynthesis protein StrF domain-containing protein n=1 Tax=Natronomonas aquatica TaxID=2841590 RepID=A0A9R1D7B5_9EURY|nr:glycosyltransferase family 2 protein [Natronomonas aquatica]MCQ4333115.1 hypothetical protein [Natronomonas aquatica]
MMDSDAPIFSVICVYNDRETLEKSLLSSLKNQCEDWYETILIDNRNQDYHSAAAALNAGAERASGKYYLFLHQDVKLLGDKWFKKARHQAESIGDLGAAGFAGVTVSGIDPETKGRNTISQGADKRKWRLGTEITAPRPVQTVDELGLLVPRDVFSDHQFDSTVCDGWHLYAVEYCLRMKYQTDLGVYALPMNIWHNSSKNAASGAIQDIGYYKTLVSVVESYSDLEMIYTTCGFWPANIWYTKTILYSLSILNTILPSSLSERVINSWPSIWGGAVPLLWQEGRKAVPVLLKEIRQQT